MQNFFLLLEDSLRILCGWRISQSQIVNHTFEEVHAARLIAANTCSILGRREIHVDGLKRRKIGGDVFRLNSVT